MKKLCFTVALIMSLCLWILTGCGSQKEDRHTTDGTSQGSIEQSEHLDIQAEVEHLPTPSETDKSWIRVSMQFWQEKVVQIWAKERTDEKESKVWDVYLYREDGSGELLYEGAPKKYFNPWFLDENGNYFILSQGIIQLNENKEEIYHWSGGNVLDICQQADGRIMMLVRETTGAKSLKLAEWNLDTGEVDFMEHIAIDSTAIQYLGVGEQGLLLMDEAGFWEIDVEKGTKFCVMSLEGTSYQWGIVSDFRALADGKIEVLQDGSKETLQLVNIRETRTIITVRGASGSTWFDECIEKFNNINDTYYVVEEHGGDHMTWLEYYTKTSVEIATGGGPDIIGGNIMGDNPGDLIEIGAFAELSAYMEQSDIREDDYFPITFDTFRDGDNVYSVNVIVQPVGNWVDQSLLNNGEISDVEGLLDALLNYQERAIFSKYWDSNTMLSFFFLVGTEDIWGAVDWEEGTCDFDSELFAKMLKVAKQYGDDGKNDYPVLTGGTRELGFYTRDSFAELESEGKVYIGYYFDDGCYPLCWHYDAMAINNNSPNKEGAWEFLSYLLSEETQLELVREKYDSSVGTYEYPVSRKAFEIVAAEELAEGAIGEYLSETTGKMIKFYKAGQEAYSDLGRNEQAYKELYDLTEAEIEEIRNKLENTKIPPTRTETIVEIICEEAAAYFANQKSVDEVIAIIENRVQLYLDENN